MGTIIGFVIGYILGVRDGQSGTASDTLEAWRTIRKSEEFKALVLGGVGIVSQTIRHWQTILLFDDSTKKSD